MVERGAARACHQLAGSVAPRAISAWVVARHQLEAYLADSGRYYIQRNYPGSGGVHTILR
jgi:hypothetical protein